MDADKIVKVKHQDKLASQLVVRPKPKLELEAQRLQSPPAIRPPEGSESVEQIEAKSEPTEYMEALTTTQSTGSIFGSGWEYSQLLKEFRDDFNS